jgi:hypothetical protein
MQWRTVTFASTPGKWWDDSRIAAKSPSESARSALNGVLAPHVASA